MSYLARSIKCFLAFAHMKHLCIQTLARTISTHTLEQRASIGDQRHPAHRTVLCRRFRVTADDNLANLKVQVAPCDLTRFTFPAARERQAAHEVRAISRTPCPGVFYNLDNLKKLITARQRELLCAHWHAFQAFRGVAVDNTCILRHVEHMS